VDAYLFHLAAKAGAHPRLATRIADVEIDPDTGVVLRTDKGEEFRASYVVDASGYRSPLSDTFALREEPTRARTHTRTLFTHMIGVQPYDNAPSAQPHRKPSPWHNGTLHHCFDGGWVWVIPFDNHPGARNPLCSVGLTLDPRKYPKNGASPEQEWADFLARFPEIAWQFTKAVAVRPWVSTGRLQYSAKQVVGERFCLTSHAAGFIDALYSRGMTNTTEVINALAWRLIEASRDGDWSTKRFEHVEALQQGLFDVHDDLVYSSFVGFSNYELWNAVNRVWQLTTMLGNIVIEDAYYRFAYGDRDDQVFRDMEQAGEPGSPFAVSAEFSELLPLTVQACREVEAGTTTPEEAASRILGKIAVATYLPPAFGFGEPDNRCFSATPGKMARNAVWSLRHAPKDIAVMSRRATAGLIRMRMGGE
jgi:FADH2 O2-dependent halogenase